MQPRDPERQKQVQEPTNTPVAVVVAVSGAVLPQAPAQELVEEEGRRRDQKMLPMPSRTASEEERQSWSSGRSERPMAKVAAVVVVVAVAELPFPRTDLTAVSPLPIVAVAVAHRRLVESVVAGIAAAAAAAAAAGASVVAGIAAAGASVVAGIVGTAVAVADTEAEAVTAAQVRHCRCIHQDQEDLPPCH